MAKKNTTPATALSAQYRADAQQMIGTIVGQLQKSSHFVGKYNGQRRLLATLFGNPSYTRDDIIIRLIVLDELYSTGARYAHFAFDDLADAIPNLGSRQQASNYFYSIAQGGPDYNKLFSNQYGINSNGQGRKMPSLLSKYAYYELLQNKQLYPLGFPIYDSLALAMIPQVFHNLQLSLPKKPNTGKTMTDKTIGASIENYILCVNNLRIILLSNNALCQGRQPFDVLDAYLWRMGKFSSGNLSLLIENKQDYDTFVKYIKKNTPVVAKQDFSDRVYNYLRSVNRSTTGNPFVGLSNGSYLTALYQHWFKYF